MIFIYGPDTFRSLKKLKEFKEKFLREVEGGSLNLTELDGEKISFGDFKKEISTISFMARKRMIVLKNITKSKKKELQKEIVEYLKSISEMQSEKDENILIFYEEDAKVKEPLVKFLISAGSEKLHNKKTSGDAIQRFSVCNRDFPFLKCAELRNWIINAVKEKGANINTQAVVMLVERIGSDLWSMNNELEKIISYDKNITCESIKKFVKTKDDDNIFNLVDAIGAKNKKVALRLLTEQIRLGVNINYILFMLARQYRLLLEAKDFLARDERANPRTLSVALKINPFVAPKLYSQVKFYDIEALKKIYRCIMNIDLKSKSTSVNIELLLDMLIIS